jgi:hypothetical protein
MQKFVSLISTATCCDGRRALSRERWVSQCRASALCRIPYADFGELPFHALR